MRAYRKLIVAFVGISVMLANRLLGWPIMGIEPLLVDAIVSVLTLVGVERFANDPPRKVARGRVR